MKSSLILLLLFFHIPSDQNLPEGFVYLQDAIPNVSLDLRYFSSDNFVGDTIDGYQAEKCIISMKAVLALFKVQQELNTMDYGLKVKR